MPLISNDCLCRSDPPSDQVHLAARGVDSALVAESLGPIRSIGPLGAQIQPGAEITQV